MSTPKDGPPHPIEVENAEAAMHKMQAFTRRVLSVSKSEVDAADRRRATKKRAKRR